MRLSALASALAVAACAPRSPEAAGPPPMPHHSGPLVIDVVYPPDSGLISARDSNFVFGSVGNGNASLSINGYDVPVEPNGAFLAWLPVPGLAADSVADYQLDATLDGERLRIVHTVRLPPPTQPPVSDSAMIVETSFSARGAWWVRADERVSLRFSASPGAIARLLLPDGDTLPLRELWATGDASAANWIFGRVPSLSAMRSGSGIYAGELKRGSRLGRGWRSPRLLPVPTDFSGTEPLCTPPAIFQPEGDTSYLAPDTMTAPIPSETGDAAATQAPAFPEGCGVIEVVVGEDTARTPLPLDLWILDEPGPVVELREEPSGTGRDGFVVGRAAPGATTLWMWTGGVRARVTGRRNGSVRLALDERSEAWVALDELVWIRRASPPARARVSTARFESERDLLRVQLSVDAPVPYHVEVSGSTLTLILYGAFADTNWLRYGADDPFLKSASWEQVAADRYLLHIELGAPPWGYRVRHIPGTLRLEIRRPPPIDPERPFADRKIAVDPGHPPGGSTGPTRLYEGDANLAVAMRLKRLLEAEGAEVILTRADRGAVRLYDRTQLAELLDADVLVSVHNNALPDGVNPFENHGTSVYYFHGHALDLARALQRRLLESMGLADLGIGRASLALARPAWMPAALTEGAFMMIPTQEAGLRNPAFQEAYARGLLEGLRDFLLERAR